jgi:hypothetical protein
VYRDGTDPTPWTIPAPAAAAIVEETKYGESNDASSDARG